VEKIIREIEEVDGAEEETFLDCYGSE